MCPVYTHVTPIPRNALVHVIYSRVSGQCSHTICSWFITNNTCLETHLVIGVM